MGYRDNICRRHAIGHRVTDTYSPSVHSNNYCIRHAHPFAEIITFLNRSQRENSESVEIFLIAYFFKKLEHFLGFCFSQEKSLRGTFSPGTTAVGSTGSKKINYFRRRTPSFLMLEDDI